MLATEPGLAIVWDEGYTLGREDRIRWWFQALADPPAFAAKWRAPSLELVQPEGSPPAPRTDQIDTRAELFSPQNLLWFWPFAREEPHGHPPFYALLGLIGDFAMPWAPQLSRARFGPILLFSLTSAALFGFVRRRYGPWAAALGSAAWVLQPNLFGHGHYAAYDMPLASLWLLSVLTFWRAVEPEEGTVRDRPRWGWVVAFGLLCGWAADTKLTGWFMPGPFMVWALIYRDRRAFWTILVGGLVAVSTLWAFNPAWWFNPVGGIVTFLRSNLSRAQTRPIEIMYLGTVYNTPIESLPWHNTLVWTLFVTPVGFLAFALAGVGRTFARFTADPFAVLACLHWFAVLTLRALPRVPGHDGVRQFLAAFGLLALVAAIGAGWCIGRFGKVGKALVSLAILEGSLSIAVFWPVPVSYFSPLVGSLPGAVKLGMEPTYYWDALTPEVLDWLNSNTPPGRTVVFATNPTSWLYLKRTGQLKVPVTGLDPGQPRWLVIQNRPGAFGPQIRELLRTRKPAYTYSRWGVPLIWVVPLQE